MIFRVTKNNVDLVEKSMKAVKRYMPLPVRVVYLNHMAGRASWCHVERKAGSITKDFTFVNGVTTKNLAVLYNKCLNTILKTNPRPSSKLVCFLDDDILLDPNWLTYLIKTVTADTHIMASGPSCGDEFKTNQDMISPFMRNLEAPALSGNFIEDIKACQERFGGKIYMMNEISLSCMVAKKALFDAQGFSFDEQDLNFQKKFFQEVRNCELKVACFPGCHVRRQVVTPEE